MVSAAALRALHLAGKPLVLPNVWDAASAALVEEAGFAAVATSSVAVAHSLGHADGEQAPAADMFAAASRIAGAVSVPVTVDAEAGYGLPPGELVERLLAADASGCNIEDTDHRLQALREPAEQAERLAAIREAAGDALVLNARIDVFLGASDPGAVLPDAVERARAYLDAGADCVYPIHLGSTDVAASFIDAVRPASVNLTATASGPTITDFTRLGAARVSLGAGMFKAQQSWLRSYLAAMAT